ncbi:unnamed protein product [Citrullus colocynthis]|uniref:Uncharacterized protein n=1 Tax=Citrullus colocynthis TaxID=252529 RepID=A0ABP0YT28_9ROSI
MEKPLSMNGFGPLRKTMDQNRIEYYKKLEFGAVAAWGPLLLSNSLNFPILPLPSPFSTARFIFTSRIRFIQLLKKN